MKKILILLFLFLIPLVAQAEFNLGKWRYYRDIEVENVGFNSFIIDKEIYARANSRLSDLRIIDANNNEVPYRLTMNRPSFIANSYHPQLVSVNQASANTIAVIDLGENYGEVNQIRINTPTENFLNNVKISGGNTQTAWHLIENQEYIYDVTDRLGDFRALDSLVDFSRSHYRYYRLEIINNPEIEIVSVQAYLGEPLAFKEKNREPEFNIETNKNSQTTFVDIDLGSHGIPTSRIELDIAAENFSRGVTVLGSYDRNNWSVKATGYIFQSEERNFQGENFTINYNEANNQFLRVVIRDKGKEPIQVDDIKVYSIDRELTFATEEGKDYRLYYGHNSPEFPRYDLQKAWETLDNNVSDKVSLSGMKYNTEYKSRIFVNFSWWQELWLYAVVGLIIMVVGAILILMIRFLEKK